MGKLKSSRLKAKYDLFKTETEATSLQSSVDDVKILINKGE